MSTMTVEQMWERIHAGEPLVVYGEAIIINTKLYPTDPHAHYRKAIAAGRLRLKSIRRKNTPTAMGVFVAQR